MTFMGTTTDLNSNLGEVFGPWKMGDGIVLLDIVTSANIICRYHADDASVMMETCEAVAARGVHTGAHVAYRDLTGFG